MPPQRTRCKDENALRHDKRLQGQVFRETRVQPNSANLDLSVDNACLLAFLMVSISGA